MVQQTNSVFTINTFANVHDLCKTRTRTMNIDLQRNFSFITIKHENVLFSIDEYHIDVFIRKVNRMIDEVTYRTLLIQKIHEHN
jgi:CYTH domain-containing protein